MWEGRNGDGDKIVKRQKRIECNKGRYWTKKMDGSEIKARMRMMIDRKINDVKINRGWYESAIKSKNENEEK